MQIDQAQATAEAVANTEETTKVSDLVARTSVHDNVTMETAVKWTAEVKVQREAIDAKRKSWVEPLNAVVKDINNSFRPAIEGLKASEQALKDKISAHVSSSLARRDMLLASVQSAPPESRQAVVAEVESLAVAEVKGLSIRENWTGSVTDREALIDWCLANNRRDLLGVNEKSLKAMTKATGRDLGIPGWTATCNRTSVVTPSRVVR